MSRKFLGILLILLGLSTIVYSFIRARLDFAPVSVSTIAFLLGTVSLGMGLSFCLSKNYWKGRDKLLKGTVFFVSCLICIVPLEVISREMVRCRTYKNCPNASYSVDHVEYTFSVQLNSDGYRDGEFSRVPESPIAIIGDSHTFGWGVEQDKTFSHLLEAKLGVEGKVLNLGVEGHDLLEYLMVLKTFLGKTEFFVLFITTGNDFFLEVPKAGPPRRSAFQKMCALNLCELLSKNMARISNNLDARGMQNPLRHLDIDTLKRNVTDPRLVDLALSWKLNPHLLKSAIERPNLNKWYEDTMASFLHVPTNKEALSKFVSILKHAKKRLIVFLIPPNFMVADSYVEAYAQLGFYAQQKGQLVCDPRLHGMITEFLVEQGVEVVDLQKYFCNDENVDTYYYRWDGHLTPRGHEFIANVLFRKLGTQP